MLRKLHTLAFCSLSLAQWFLNFGVWEMTVQDLKSNHVYNMDDIGIFQAHFYHILFLLFMLTLKSSYRARFHSTVYGWITMFDSNTTKSYLQRVYIYTYIWLSRCLNTSVLIIESLIYLYYESSRKWCWKVI